MHEKFIEDCYKFGGGIELPRALQTSLKIVYSGDTIDCKNADRSNDNIGLLNFCDYAAENVAENLTNALR